MKSSTKKSHTQVAATKVGSLVEFGTTPHHQIKEMDDDHRDIVSALRQMQDAFDTGTGDIALLKSHAEHLIEAVCGHFYREAKAMHEVSYDKIGSHLKAHAALCGQIHHAMDTCGPNDAAALSAIPGSVMSWLNGHIMTDDMDYARHVQSSDVDSRLTMQLTVEAEMSNFACDETCRKRSGKCGKKQ